MTTVDILEELQAKYPRGAANMVAEPMSDCPMCNGTGEYTDTRGIEVWCGCTALSLDFSHDRKMRILTHLAEQHAVNLEKVSFMKKVKEDSIIKPPEKKKPTSKRKR